MTKPHNGARAWLGWLAMAFGGTLIAAQWWLLARRRPPVRAADLVLQPEMDVWAERTGPGRVVLHWRGGARRVTVYAGPSAERMDFRTPVAVATNANSIAITGRAGQRRTFRLHFDGGELDGAQVTTAERVLTLDGVANLRDIGGYRTSDGYRVRWGRVFRSGALNAPTPADLEHLNDLGLRLVCDLRGGPEVEEAPDVLPVGTRYAHLPVRGGDTHTERVRALFDLRFRPADVLANGYTGVLVQRNGPVFGGVLRLLADADNLPAVLHCTAGKDRTGLAVALLLRLLGVPEDTVIADYTLSNLYYDHFNHISVRANKALAQLGFRAGDWHYLLLAEARTLRLTLRYIHRHFGSVENYLRERAGVDDALIDRLRANLLEAE